MYDPANHPVAVQFCNWFNNNLTQMLTESLQGEAVYVLWAASDADKCIRNWFGLSGNGKYSIEMSFGKVKYSDYGYALIIENGAIRQIPLIHPDSSYDIYYKENKQTQYVKDAADVLGHFTAAMFQNCSKLWKAND